MVVNRSRPAGLRPGLLTYNQLPAEFVGHLWESGLTTAPAGNAPSASLAGFPELRGRRALSDWWYLVNACSRVEAPNRALSLSP